MRIANLENYERLFICGDIHGCIEIFAPLIEHIFTVEKFTEKDQLVFLGDYIDRGEDSKGVVDILLDIKKTFPKTVFLRGNHEDMLLGFLGLDGCYGDAYLMNGGDQMLKTYGLPDYPRETILKDFPKDHLEFFTSLTDVALSRKCLLVHAGLDLKKELENQDRKPQRMWSEDTIYWVRDRFYSQCHSIRKPYMGRTIIHGHTIVPEVSFDMPMRIMIDTGSYREKGKITCFLANEDDLINSKLIQSHRTKGIIIK